MGDKHWQYLQNYQIIVSSVFVIENIMNRYYFTKWWSQTNFQVDVEIMQPWNRLFNNFIQPKLAS